jgi:hypothetical protein
MKKLFFYATVLFLIFGTTSALALTTMDYDDVILSGGFQAGHFPEWWDLTAGDIVISFTYDANGLVDDAGAHAWAELGVRSPCYGDFNPTWMVEGAGVWLATDYDWTVNTFAPDPAGLPTLDLDDKLILQKGGGQGEGAYDLPSPPPNPGANHRVWWDRDGVDPWQNPATANTGGIYEIIITLHATSDTAGTAYMNIRGLYQGFETDGNWNTIELTPAGMTFTGDMKHLQVFYGLYGYGATHSVAFNDITVQGHLGEPPMALCLKRPIDIKPCSYPNSINLKSKGVVPVALLTSGSFYAGSVDPTTVEFAGALPVRWTMEDVGSECGSNDGSEDLLLFFDTQELNLGKSSTEAFLTGFTYGGEFIWGKDTVNIVPKGK